MTEEFTEKITSGVQQKTRRKRLFSVLDSIIDFAEQKRTTPNNTDKVKQAWARIAVSAIGAYGTLLKDCELEEIEERLSKLETLEKWK
jgi:hypothetical protein